MTTKTTANGRIEIDVEDVAERLTYNDQLRKSRPTNETGLVQYLWRHARFHSGADTSMPVTASWWLAEYLDERGIDASVSGVMDEDGKQITSDLSEVVDAVLEEMGYRTDGAARAWSGVL